MIVDKDRSTHRVALVTGYEDIGPDILRRLLLVLALLAFVTFVLWLDREGLEDTTHPDLPLTVLDLLYYAVITITTTGYGDIIPVTPRARLISTLIIAPVRIIVLIIFIGTAYQIVLQRYREAFRMRQVQKRLHNHIIICGYGVKGHATVGELLSFGRTKEEIVVIDANEHAADDAARDGLTAFRADATSEAALTAAGIENAQYVIIDVDRDDTTVLICLTANHLNPEVCVVAAAKEAENVPLIYRSGADVVVAPPIAGGRMLAIATHLTHAPKFLDDMITFGRGLDFGEKRIQPEEAGKTIEELTGLEDKLPIGAYHRSQSYTFDQLSGLHFDTGDVIIYLIAKT